MAINFHHLAQAFTCICEGLLIEKFQSDTAKELIMQNSVEEDDQPFDIEITDDSVIYGYDENSSRFNRGFWINTDFEDETEELPLSDLLSDDKDLNSDNKNEEEE